MYKPTFYWVSCCCYSEFPSSAFFQGYLASLHPGKKNASWKWPKGGSPWKISWFVSIHFPLPWFCGGNETAMPDNVGPLTSAVSAASLAASKLHSAIDILASTMFGPPKRPKSRSFFTKLAHVWNHQHQKATIRDYENLTNPYMDIEFSVLSSTFDYWKCSTWKVVFSHHLWCRNKTHHFSQQQRLPALW